MQHRKEDNGFSLTRIILMVVSCYFASKIFSPLKKSPNNLSSEIVDFVGKKENR